jgi:hypothetical protein
VAHQMSTKIYEKAGTTFEAAGDDGVDSSAVWSKGIDGGKDSNAELLGKSWQNSC